MVLYCPCPGIHHVFPGLHRNNHDFTKGFNGLQKDQPLFADGGSSQGIIRHGWSTQVLPLVEFAESVRLFGLKVGCWSP